MHHKERALDAFRLQLSTLLDAIQHARLLTDAFFARLTTEAMYLRSIAERHRIIFYLGHLEAFDWNLLGTRVFSRPPIHPTFEQLFAFGIDPVDGNLPTDVPSDWPALHVVSAFCAQIRSTLDATLAHFIDTCADTDLATRDALAMALEHRLMHLETLSYMLPHLPLSAFVPSQMISVRSQPGPTEPDYQRVGFPHSVRRVEVPAGDITIGRNRDDAFGWDNEFGAQTLSVPAFAIAARKVVNQEFLSFVRAGGYREQSLWTAEDWAWKESRDLQLPILWEQRGDDYFQRAAFEIIPLPLDWPVQVSLAEARAFVAYLHAQDSQTTARLPSEAELHRAAYGTLTSSDPDPQYPWPGQEAIPLLHGNFGGARFDSCPVGAFPAGDSRLGVADLFGNHWEWSQTPFRPLPGFQIDPRYPGYSANFYDNKHFVMKGAAACTDVRFLRRTFRNWFQAHYPYVFAGFRCVYQPSVQ